MPTPKVPLDLPPGLTAAVIGSGFGGLAMAIRLQSSGIQTTLFESLPQLGGRAGFFELEGYKFDMGPTVITAPDTLESLFALSGRKMQDYVELLPLSPMYRLFWEDGTRFDYHQDEKNLLAEIKRLSPEDVEGYHRYFNYALEVFKEGYVKLCHVPFQSFWDMAKVAPQLLRLSAQVSVYSKVKSFFKSEKLRQAFSFNSLLIGGNPFRASAIYTLIHPLERAQGVFWAKGGTHVLVNGLGKLFQDLGGTIQLSSPVDEILTKGDQVTGLKLKSGQTKNFSMVVSNADVTNTYTKLLRNTPTAASHGQRLQKKSHSMSLYVLYFGTNKKFPGILHHNVMFGPRYKELLTDIFDRGIVADDFSLYLHAPSVSDPSMAPAGGECFYVLSPVPHLGHGRKDPQKAYDWKGQGAAYGDRIIDYLEKHAMPGLRESIVVREERTPLDFETTLDSYLGAAFSLEPILTQSAFFRVHNRDDRLKGLYFAGAGTHPGAGIPGVVGSAQATASVIFADYSNSESQKKDATSRELRAPAADQWTQSTP